MSRKMYRVIAVASLLIAAPALGAEAPEQSGTSKVVLESPETNIGDLRPNALSIELFGRGGLYTFNYDRTIANNFALGAGFEYFPTSTTVTNFGIPVYANWYFNPGPKRGFLTANGTWIIQSKQGSPNYLAVHPMGGGGYEYRSERGFLFRIAAYVCPTTDIPVWGGLTFGGTF